MILHYCRGSCKTRDCCVFISRLRFPRRRAQRQAICGGYYRHRLLILHEPAASAPSRGELSTQLRDLQGPIAVVLAEPGQHAVIAGRAKKIIAMQPSSVTEHGLSVIPDRELRYSHKISSRPSSRAKL